MNHHRSLLLLSILVFSGLITTSAAADLGEPTAAGAQMPWVLQALLHCALFGILGILLVTAGFKVFDAVIRRIDLEQEVAKGNLAAAILSGAAIVAIGIIVAAAIN